MGKDKSNGTQTTIPKHVAIVALGPSALGWTKIVEAKGGRSAHCDAVWAINSYGNVLDHDLVFHMDDVRIQEIRASAGNQKIANMLAWMKTHDKPIMTARAHPDYPALMEFPLQNVVNGLGVGYFNSTIAYALAYAIYIGVDEISVWGADFSFENQHEAEKGRACCEYWIGRAHEKGIGIHIAAESTLMDACVPEQESWYGYDTLDVTMMRSETGASFAFTEKKQLPTAQQIEANYDHGKAPKAKAANPQGMISGMFGEQALKRLLGYKDAKNILDIGSGSGAHAELMLNAGRQVTTVSMIKPADHIGDYLCYKAHEKFDAIWACHVLEHMPNPNLFLAKCFRDLRDDGLLAITVPPMKPGLVGGHVTLWTPALVLYHLILAGFDCRDARVSPLYANEGPYQVPYNLSVIVRKKQAKLPDDLICDAGDIEKLKEFFPFDAYQDCDGRLAPVRWDIDEYDDPLRRKPKLPKLAAMEEEACA